MSLFGLKDALGGGNDEQNDYDTNQFFSHNQDLSFGGSETSHQNGFNGLSGYGAHGINQLTQQRQNPSSTIPSLPQTQLYRATSGPGLSNLPTQESSHLFNPSNAIRPGNFQSQGIIGGNIGSNLTGLPNNPRPTAVGEIGALPGLNRFPPGHSVTGAPVGSGSSNQFSGLGGQLRGGMLDDDDNDDFPALPTSSQTMKPDAGHLGSSLLLSGGVGSDATSISSQSLPGSSPSLFSTPTSSLQVPPTIGLGSSLLDRSRTHSGSLYPQTGVGGGLQQTGSSHFGNGPIESGNISNTTSLSATTTPSLTGHPGPSSLLGNIGGGGGSGLSSTAVTPPHGKDSKFGMSGLLDVIRSQEKDIHVLALGTDLTTFGLNLNATESLYTSFLSPFSEGIANDEPQYKTPQCYLMPHPPVLKADHWTKLTSETLFYIFYQMPKDILQACAAQELYRRDWRFHGELRIWLKPHTQQPQMTSSQQQQPQSQFVYFDAKAWEQKILNTQQIRGNLLAGIIPEEDIRVKVPTPGQQQGNLVEPAQI